MDISYNDLSRSRQSCHHCQRIVIAPPASILDDAPFKSFINSFEFSLREVLDASESSCVLFQRIARYLEEDFFEDPPPNVQWFTDNQPDRKILLHFEIKPSIFDAINEDPPYTCAISWLWEWANESKDGQVCFGSIDKFTYELCSEPEDPAAELVKQKPRYPYVASETTFTFVQESLRECDLHPECTIQSHSLLESGPGPSRLVDVGTSEDDNVHIIIAKDNMRYLALSYCWGNNDSMKLTSDMLTDWIEGIQFSLLPKTLKDAVMCTRQLGLRYLWVDRLCIIQDDEMDKAREIAAMPQIYSMAYLTISAASAKSSEDGFLKTRKETHEAISLSWVELPYLSSKGASGLVTLKLSESCEDFNWPNTRAIDSRAWTMQEQILSPRLLHFCTFHIVWKCKAREKIGTSEAIERSQPAWSKEQKVGQENSILNSWENIIARYTERKLSCPDDKLTAISAVAQAYCVQSGALSKHHQALLQEQTSEIQPLPRAYVAGLWRHEMPFALCWWRPWDGQPEFRPLSPRAPSWSWASVDGSIFYYESTNTASYNTNATILAYDITLKSPLQEFGAVSSGELKLRGRLKEGIQLDYSSSNIEVQNVNGIAGNAIFFPDARDDQLGSGRMITAFALQIGDSTGFFWNGVEPLKGPYGLVLLPVDDETFRRIGFFQADLDMGFDDLAFQDITIV
ncbi:HET-domain-containing protein [Mollisia scopiformis]|uniref:HET-domain-containing protein n=1 Tax=Mollisia scopiformis TaxID=149040 RepID=A0A194WWW2_MOLSC|nr:HET-domain-containing protein [Mollisia scopiformis]KUJ12463.1 HET-domain-containing protein [Mollisia scopiformis]